MAKQAGDIILVGTIDDLTFYKMQGRGYARRKSSLTGKRVKKDPRFKRTMQSAHRLGRGSQLASRVYRSLPKQQQVYMLYKELKSQAIRALKEGKSEEAVMALLQQRVGKDRTPEAPAVAAKKNRPVGRPQPVFTKKLFSLRGGRRNRVLARTRRHHPPLGVLRE